jgi:hypothetical protein
VQPLLTAQSEVNPEELIQQMETNAQVQTIEDQIAQAEAETDTNQTEGQKKAGNCKKEHVSVQSFDIG